MLTSVDHWLRDKILFQTHFYTLRLPEEIPRGVKISELPISPSNKFRYRLIANSTSVTDKLVEKLGEAGMMYKTQVVERKTPLKSFICPNKGKGSVLLRVFWIFSLAGLAMGSTRLFKMITSDPVLMENLKGALAIFTES